MFLNKICFSKHVQNDRVNMNKKLNLNVLFYYLDEFLRNRLLNIYDQLFGCFCFVFVTYRVTNRQKSENIKLQRHNLKIMQEYNKNRELLMSQPKEVNIMGSLIAMESIVRFFAFIREFIVQQFSIFGSSDRLRILFSD